MLTAVLLSSGGWIYPAGAQPVQEEPAVRPGLAANLDLDPGAARELQQAIDARDYPAAEKLLLPEIDRDPRSPRSARLLAYVGSVYFANQDYLNAAVAWKKSEAIEPLDARLRFSLAMSYVRLQRPDWARGELEALEREHSNDALYPYWLGRLDYDGHFYKAAITHFEHAIELDGKLARAYDNLGLCYYYENQNDLAVANFKKAIELERGAPHPSPWPYLNLAVTEQFLNRLPEARQNLLEAVRIDAGFAKAHFQLGTVLEDEGNWEGAISELKVAARLDASYPEPHMAMARIYHKTGHEEAAREEVKTYLRLHPHQTP